MSAVDVKEEFFKNNPLELSVENKKTFAGIVYDDEVFVKIAEERKWKDDTVDRYLKDLNKYVFNHKYFKNVPVNDITRKHCEAVINNVIETRKKSDNKRIKMSNNEEAQKHIAFVLGKIFEKASELGLCENVIWGSRYKLLGIDTGEQKKLREELVVLPKSLTIDEENAVAEKVLEDPEQSGEFMAIALMFCLGLRENEACAVDFKDEKMFKCDVGRSYLQIAKSAITRKSREVKFGGKTRNAVRLVPIPSKLHELLKKRKKYIRECAKGEINHLERYPIACKGMKFRQRLTPEEVGKSGTRLLRDVSNETNISGDDLEEKIEFIDENLANMEDQSELDLHLIEKDPTAYLFRRNVATHLSILGLNQSEIEYIMGHDIKDERDSRNFFKNEDKLYPIALKMAQRPIVNEIGKDNIIEYDNKSFIKQQNINKIQVNISLSSRDQIFIQVRQREPSDYFKAVIQKDDSISLAGEYRAFPIMDVPPESVNILEYYHKRYNDYDKTKMPDEE